MAAQGSEQHVAGLEVVISGSELPPEMRNELLEVRVKENLALPASAIVKIRDPVPEETIVDHSVFNVGNEIEIRTGGLEASAVVQVFKGEIVAFEPEWEKTGCIVSIRALDKSHRLQRASKVRTFQEMKASDILQKIVGEYGLSSEIDATDTVYPFFQQSGETDRDLIAAFEREYDCRFYLEDGKAKFKKVDALAGQSPTELTFGDNLITFRPRMSSVQQVAKVNVRGWDYKRKEVINGASQTGEPTAKVGEQQKGLTTKFGNHEVLVPDRSVETTAEANAVAQATINRMADAYVEATGSCLGNPELHAGKMVRIKNVGTKFGGDYLLTAVTHSYRGAKGYYTSFEISGSSARGLLDLVHPPPERNWTANLVIGIVTNTKDPEKLGRVRVKYPALSDAEEGAWGRIITLAASNNRGALMMPEVGDEVIVGFENGDPRRPLILGAVFGGVNKPTTEMLDLKGDIPEGSFGVVSNKKGWIQTKEDFTLKSDGKLVIQIKGDREEKTDANLKSEASQAIELKAGQSYKIDGGNQVSIQAKSSLEIISKGTLKLEGTSVEIKSSGPAKLQGATVDVQGQAMTNIKGAMINLG
jgi:uncharacterized protein involved in type VI secretion and phage assembly